MAKAKEEYLVDSEWLADHAGDSDIVLVDTRPAPEYWAAHLEGARHFDPFPFHFYDTSESKLGEFVGQLEWIFSAIGITGSDTVVFYENDAGMRAARGVWILEYIGHPKVRILDGGLKGAARIRMSTIAPTVTPTQLTASPRSETIASFDYVLKNLGSRETRIFDVRSDAEYFGERVRAKHGGAIPGAVHLDWAECLDAAGRFKPADELREQFARLGLRPENEVVTYCQGGYRAAHTYIALKRAGFESVRNYIGSWAEWGNRDDLPIEHPRRRA